MAIAVTPAVVRGQSPVASETTEVEQRELRLDYMKQAAARYTIRQDGDEEDLKQEEPILRWSEPVISVLDGLTVIWTHEGRPTATVDIWLRADGETHHTFQSLSQEPLTAERDGTPVWHPTDPGVEFQPIPRAPNPAGTPRQRLIQMRALLRQFDGYVVGGPQEGGGRIELRPLPQPLYRYENDDSGILDGAVFVLAKGTNPEIMILLEAAEGSEGNFWRFATAPKTNREAEVRFRGETILTLKYEKLRDPSHTIFGVVEYGPAWDVGIAGSENEAREDGGPIDTVE